MRRDKAREPSARAELTIREALERGDPREAAAALASAYGHELHGWLTASYGAADASEIYGDVMLRVSAAISGFRGDSAARTWLYQVARNEARQALRRRRRTRAVFTPLDRHPSAEERPASEGQREDRDARVAALRARLSEEDRSLLVLRIDRGFSYREIASMAATGADDAAPERGAARLRRRVPDVGRRRLSSLDEERA